MGPFSGVPITPALEVISLTQKELSKSQKNERGKREMPNYSLKTQGAVHCSALKRDPKI